MDSVVALMVILFCLGISVILVLKNRDLAKQAREMEEQFLDFVDRIQEQKRAIEKKSALYQTLEEEKQTLLDRNQALEVANQGLLERNETFKQALREKHPGLIEKNEALKEENQALREERRELMDGNESLQDELDRRTEQIRSCSEEFQKARRERQEFIDKNKSLQDELGGMTDRLRRSTEELKKARREVKELPVREWREWLKSLTRLSYGGEIEVEVKFILPLVKYLGYRESDFKLRQAVHVRVGRGKKRGQADWVLYDSSKRSQVRAVIEAKAPNQLLDNEAQEQARSYAFALGAPVYALTNGKRFKVFRCRVQGDTCIVDRDVRSLGDAWSRIHQEMGVGPAFSTETPALLQPESAREEIPMRLFDERGRFLG